MSNWISVKDRLPEKSQRCIIYERYEYRTISLVYYFSENKKWQDEIGDEYYPTHWMPLPEPSKEKEDDFKELYFDLLFEVVNKYPNETRHETAKRYIREVQNHISESVGEKSK